VTSETTVLVVDDDDVIRRLIEHQLTGVGYRVVTAADGDEAMAAIERAAPDLAVLSLDLPGTGGVDLCRRLRARGRDEWIYTLVITDAHDSEGRIRASEAGADDLIDRPFRRGELLWRLRAGQRIGALERDLAGRDEKLRRLEDDETVDPAAAIERAWAVTSRQGAALACIVIGVDPGTESEPDRVIGGITSTLRRTFASADQVFRTGARELLVLLPGSTAAMAAVAAERARVAISAMLLPGLDGRSAVTASLGIAERSKGMTHAGDLLDGAHDALADARAAGGDCIRIAPTAAHPYPTPGEDGAARAS
jgi:diguanylate cyclase (GGDEF)-like protein